MDGDVKCYFICTHVCVCMCLQRNVDNIFGCMGLKRHVYFRAIEFRWQRERQRQSNITWCFVQQLYFKWLNNLQKTKIHLMWTFLKILFSEDHKIKLVYSKGSTITMAWWSVTSVWKGPSLALFSLHYKTLVFLSPANHIQNILRCTAIALFFFVSFLGQKLRSLIIGAVNSTIN